MEIRKENTTKEIPELKFPMKLLQNQKLESELNDFQSIPIISCHPPFLNEDGREGVKFPKKWVRGNWFLGIIFSFLAITVTDIAFAF